MSSVTRSESVTSGGDWPVGITGGGSETLTSCVVADGVDKNSLEIKVEKVLGFYFM